MGLGELSGWQTRRHHGRVVYPEKTQQLRAPSPVLCLISTWLVLSRILSRKTTVIIIVVSGVRGVSLVSY